eukprot:355678-Chlamydomonas_euryale.AAC.2
MGHTFACSGARMQRLKQAHERQRCIPASMWDHLHGNHTQHAWHLGTHATAPVSSMHAVPCMLPGVNTACMHACVPDMQPWCLRVSVRACMRACMHGGGAAGVDSRLAVDAVGRHAADRYALRIDDCILLSVQHAHIQDARWSILSSSISVSTMHHAFQGRHGYPTA